MLRLLAVGDLHFKPGNSEENEILSCELIRIAKEISPDIIVVLGDLLHTNERIHVIPLCNIIKLLKSLSSITKTFVLIGNHDRRNCSDFLSEIHPFTGIGNQNLVIVDNVVTSIEQNYKFCFVPYVPPGKFIEALDTVDNWKQSDCIFAHQEFRGCTLSTQTKSTVGDAWPLTYPNIVSGHIHQHHRPQKNILYTGTPMQEAINEEADKSVSLLEFSKKNSLVIKETRIRPNVPRKWNIRLPVEDVPNFVLPEGIVRIILVGTREDLKFWMKTNTIKTWIEKGVKIAKDTVIKQQEEYEEIEEDFQTALISAIKKTHREEELLALLEKIL